MTSDIKSLTADELAAQFQAWGLPSYRVTQVLEWLYRQRVTSWAAMTNVPKALREKLGAAFTLQTLQLVRQQGSRARESADFPALTSGATTQKFLWRLADGAFIESVLIPSNPALYGEPSDRHTLCVSTQVGCAYGCKFCASGLDGFKRNLQPHEIVEQVLATERTVTSDECRVTGSTVTSPVTPLPELPFAVGRDAFHPRPHSLSPNQGRGWNASLPASGSQCANSSGKSHPETGEDGTRNTQHALAVSHPASSIQYPASSQTPHSALRTPRLVDNLVVMGMGEPLANYDNLLRALRILNASWGGGIGARRITISTSGLAPQIRKLADEPEQFRLAVSLHGATDAVRAQIMPVNRKFPLAQLTAALEHYRGTKGRMITFEYVLIAGVNDMLAQAQPLAALARRLRAKVNLIPYNAVEGLKWERPSDEVCEAFLAALKKQKVSATLRREKGDDIDAACGQLRLKTERELARLAP